MHQSGKLLYEGNYADVELWYNNPLFRLYFRIVKSFYDKET